MDINSFGIDDEYFGFSAARTGRQNGFSNFTLEDSVEFKAAQDKHEENKSLIRGKYFPQIDALGSSSGNDVQRQLLFNNLESELRRETERFNEEVKTIRRNLGLGVAQSGAQAIAGLFQNLGLRPRPAPSVVNTSMGGLGGGDKNAGQRTWIKPVVITASLLLVAGIGYFAYKKMK